MTNKILEETSENVSNRCFCCDGQLIQQVRNQTVRWYCLNCRQEMPNFCNLPSKAKANESNTQADTQADKKGLKTRAGNMAPTSSTSGASASESSASALTA
ncbi:MAG: hypothetical protein AAFP20_12455 [Cyanobacteria bacterium J06614_10]